jgi:hypothetical protein
MPVADAGAARDRRQRAAGVVLLLLLAPVFAELLASYLSDTGDLGASLFLVVFLAPLYGGVGLVIREVALRTGRGWRGRLLLATAFGVAMPTLVDVSLFTPGRSDIEDWDEIMAATLVGDISAYAVVTWVVGHVVMSIGAPLAVVEGLVPSVRDKTWVGARILVVIGLAGLGVAALIHFDEETGRASAIQSVVSGLVVAALVTAACSRWGRPSPTRERSLTHEALADERRSRPRDWTRRYPAVAPRLRWVAAAGFVAMVTFDLVPISWVGVALAVAVIVIVGLGLLGLACTPARTWQHIAALGYGALLARACVGFLAPLPRGVEPAAKYTQNVVLLVLVILLGLGLRRSMQRSSGPTAITAPAADDQTV